MQDYLAALERLRKGAAEAALIRDLAADQTKQAFFDLLHRHLNRLADEVERAMNGSKTALMGKKQRPEDEPKEKPARTDEAEQAAEEYASDQREIIKKLRKALN